MSYPLRSGALLYILICCIVSGCSLPWQSPASHDAPKVLDVHGREQSFAAFAHAPVLLFLWASWCPECLVELDNLDTVKEKLKGHNVQIVAVAISDTLDGVLSLPLVQRAPFPILIDAQNAVRDRYPVSGLPTTYLLGKNGRPIPLIDPEDGQEKNYVMGFREWQSAAGIQAIIGSLPK